MGRLSLTAMVLLACTESPPPAAGELRAVSYNIAGLPEGISGSQPATFIPLISGKLNPYDLVLVQEDFAYHDALLLDIEHPHVSAPKQASSRFYGDGLTRLSRSPFRDHQRVQWDLCHGGLTGASDCLAEKGFSAAWHRLDGDLELLVINHHAEAGGGAEDEAARADNFDQLARFLETVAPGKALLIAGDNNLHGFAEPDETVLTSFLTRLQLEDACRHLRCGDEHIDRFFFRSGADIHLEVSQWGVAEGFTSADGSDLSDHPPIEVMLKWSAQRGL